MEAFEHSDSCDWQGLWRLIGALPALADDANAILNGSVGDRLLAEGSPLAIDMQLLLDGRPVQPDRIDPAAVSGRLAIFVPGLMAGPMFWAAVGREPFPERLAADRGVTSLNLFYNTGLHVSVNGRQLATMIQQLVDSWPVQISEINLVGHSMGGLVSRSAAHYASEQSLPWIRMLRRMVLLGTPLRGSSLEQIANIAAFTLKWIPNPWTWLISWVFRQRSAGIKDLRHGYLVDEEWQGRSADALSTGRRHVVPLLPHVEHYVAAGSLFSDEHHPLSKIIGDALVSPYSAKDEGIDGRPSERVPTAARFFPGLSHPSIAGHDEVFAQLLEWWGPPEEEVGKVESGKVGVRH